MFRAPQTTAAAVAAGNELCRLAALAAQEFGLEVAFGGTGEADALEIVVAIGGIDTSLFVAPRLVRRAAQSFFALARDHELPDGLVPAALEASSAGWLARLEKAAGVELKVKRMAVAKPGAVAAATLAFTLPTLEGGTVAVAFPPGQAFPRLARTAGATGWAATDDLVLRLAVTMADIAMTVGELDELVAGDVLLPPGLVPKDAANVHLVISPGKAIIARIDGRTVTIERLGKAMSTNEGAAGARPGPAAAAGSPATTEPVMPAASLDDVPIRIVFDLGEVELTLAEVKSLVPGQTIDLARAPGYAVRISVNGRKIGAGEIVEIDGRLGVRIIELAGRHERPAS